MAEINYLLDRDLSEANAMAEALENYVKGDDLYGSVSGLYGTAPDMPSVTIGGLLTRLRRLKALEDQMTDVQKATLTNAEMLHDDVRQKHTGRYHEKVVNEAGARLRALEAFFAECEDDPQACADSYLPEAQRRTIVQEIVNALERYNLPVIHFDDTLRQRDAQLRRFTEPSEFIWSAELQRAYPEEVYWWLYARPKVEEAERR